MKADNVFYYLTYEGAVDMEKIEVRPSFNLTLCVFSLIRIALLNPNPDPKPDPKRARVYG